MAAAMKAESLDIETAIDELSRQLRTCLRERNIDNPVMVGIHTGGAWIAERLHKLLALTAPLGVLDISFYRDDFTRIGLNPQVRPSQMPGNIDGRHIILVDDVLYTGRTIRAALNEIFDYGRPASIILTVLIDRNGRELPIQADVSACHLELGPQQQVKLQGGPQSVQLEISALDNKG